MVETNYEGMGRFIYGAYRHGGTGIDVENWMANDLGLPHPDPNGDSKGSMYAAFFAKYRDIDELQAKYAEFIKSLNSRTL